MTTEQRRSDVANKERSETLTLERRRILHLPPEEALAAVLEHPYPVTLVQSFQEEDLYLLVHTIGPDDALPVLALASNQQWEYFLDMEIWARDRRDQRTMTEWLDRLLKADPDRFTYWITHEKLEECESYLYHNLEVRILEHDQDPSEFGNDFYTLDGTYYVRPRHPVAKEEESAGDQRWLEERDLFINDLLRRLSTYDITAYQNILLESASLIPAELEEEHYRLRNVRMAEKGFLPFEEAIGVYQPLSVGELRGRGRKPDSLSGRVLDSHPLPAEPSEAGENANLFTRTLLQIRDEHLLQRLQAEFAGLCNQIVAADQRQIRDKEGLARVVRKTGDYISIGLEKAAAEGGPAIPYQHASLIRDHLLSDIFRVGYGCALNLKWRAEKWRRQSWFDEAGLPLSFWGETWMGVLGGLLIKKPMYYDNYAHGSLYREFRTLADIEHTGRILDAITAFDDLLALMGLEVDPAGYRFLTYQNLLLTMWADHDLGLDVPSSAPRPLPLADFRGLFDSLWEQGAKPRRVGNKVKERFLAWLSERSGIDAASISERMAPLLEKLFGDIEAELGQVDPAHLDPRHIYLFLFEKKPK